MLSSNIKMRVHSDLALTGQQEPLALKIGAVALRSLFLLALIAIVAHVSLPQRENVWTIFDTPGDVIRMMVGLSAIAWVAYHLFVLPKDGEGYRTWAYLGLVLVPPTIAVLWFLW